MKESKEVFVDVFGERKWKGEMMYKDYYLKTNNNNKNLRSAESGLAFKRALLSRGALCS